MKHNMHRHLIVTFLFGWSVAVAAAVMEDGYQSGDIRGVVDDIHILVREEICTTFEVEELRTMLSNQNTEMSLMKDQMNKMMSILQNLEKPGEIFCFILFLLSFCCFDRLFKQTCFKVRKLESW